jgi:lipoyl(octanoyl) transferase
MAMIVKYKDIGSIDYQEAWDYQEKIFAQVLDIKRYNDKIKDENINEKKAWENHLLFCEHPHVYTLGQNGDAQNMLLDYIQLQAKNATFYKINRGGDITYHGPGQIVGYPIINLRNFDLGVKTYIEKLEESIILTLAEYGIKSDRLDGATGVWLDVGVAGKTRKICAIGVRASHYVTMHGFAFNVNTDLKYFDHINPCGFVDKGVTSVAKELGKEMDIEEVKMKLKANIAKVFAMSYEETN